LPWERAARKRLGAFTLFAFTLSFFQFVLRDRVALGEGYAEETLTEEWRPVLVVRSGNVLINYFADGDEAEAAHRRANRRRSKQVDSLFFFFFTFLFKQNPTG